MEAIEKLMSGNYTLDNTDYVTGIKLYYIYYLASIFMGLMMINMVPEFLRRSGITKIIWTAFDKLFSIIRHIMITVGVKSTNINEKIINTSMNIFVFVGSMLLIVSSNTIIELTISCIIIILVLIIKLTDVKKYY